MSRYIEIHFDSARDLIEHISPLNPAWQEGQYIYRGQSNSEHKLTPSICRRGEGTFANATPHRMFGVSSNAQVLFEINVLKLFLDGCDRAGIIVPGYSEEIKNKLSDRPWMYMSANSPWPPEELHGILAVAQHYAIPTRLLDWTTRSFVACYFAASEAQLEFDEINLKIAVWALDIKDYKNWQNIKLITPPGGTSPNQAAQSGLFTAHKVRTYDTNDIYPIEKLEDMDEVYSNTENKRPLIKMTLPLDESPSLLTMCASLGVDGSTLFPGFQGVARNVRDWANFAAGVRPSSSLIEEYNSNNYNED